MLSLDKIRMRSVARLVKLRTSPNWSRKTRKMNYISPNLSNFETSKFSSELEPPFYPSIVPSYTSNNESANNWRESKSFSLDKSATSPIVIPNPVNMKKLEEPIERKRDYWSNNLLYILRHEKLIPADRPVIIDNATPSEPYRLSSNVVRLLRQEPHVYIAKSNLKVNNTYNNCHNSSGSKSSLSFMSTNSSLSHMSTNSSFNDESITDGDFSLSESYGLRDTPQSSWGLFDSFWHTSQPQVRSFCTMTHKPDQESKKKSDFNLLPFEWDPVRHLTIPKMYFENDEISTEIVKFWESKRQQRHTYDHKMKMLQYLERYFRDKHFLITGSSTNGFGFNDSDVDLSCQFKSPKFLSLGFNEMAELRHIYSTLKGMKFVRNVTLIKAITPIISFTYAKGASNKIRVDLNVSNKVGLLNTQMLFAYSRMDSRVAPLVGASKQWANNMDIKSAQGGTLSSYALSLLVIFYLQQTNVVPVLHNLVPHFSNSLGFAQGESLLLPRYRSSNTKMLGDLFTDFLKYYSEFDFENSCVSVRCGHLLTPDEALSLDLGDAFVNYSSRTWWNFVKVQEPFNLTNVARSVFSEKNFEKIRKAFTRSLELITKKGGIKVLLQ